MNLCEVFEKERLWHTVTITGWSFVSSHSILLATPWNGHGYDIAKKMPGKFDFISPVWFNVQRNGRFSYQIHGDHDVDSKWMKQIKSTSSTLSYCF
jgi:chitinase domain-containing protein 1